MRGKEDSSELYECQQSKGQLPTLGPLGPVYETSLLFFIMGCQPSAKLFFVISHVTIIVIAGKIMNGWQIPLRVQPGQSHI